MDNSDDERVPELVEILGHAFSHLDGPDFDKRTEELACLCAEECEREKWRQGKKRRRRWWQRVGIVAAACLLFAFGTWYGVQRGKNVLPADVVTLTEPTSDQTTLGAKDGDQSRCPPPVAYPGTGYPYIISRTGDRSPGVAPRDSVQEPITSNGRPVLLHTYFSTAMEHQMVVCVTDQPAEEALRAVATIDFRDSQGFQRFRIALTKELGRRGITLIAVSPQVMIIPKR